MKKITLFALLIVITCTALSRETPLMFDVGSKSFCKIISEGKKIFCVTDNALYAVEKNRLHLLQLFSFTCNDAALYHYTIILATSSGIQTFDANTNTLSNFMTHQVNGNINHVQTDEYNNIWYTKEFEGCYKISSHQQVEQIIKVPVTYSLVHTSDSTIWVGTNIGLYKVPVSGKEIERYAEEGIASNDLPDNLVERLFAGAHDGLWAVMPGHVSYISSGQTSEETPDFESLGSKDNDLYSITEIPSFQQAFLFITSQGILYMPGFYTADLLRTGEIHQTVNEKAFQLSDTLLQKPGVFKNEVVQAIQFINDKVYFITKKGLWSLQASKFKQNLKEDYNKK